MDNNEIQFTKVLGDMQTLMKGILLKDKKTMMKIMQLENDHISLMEKQLELEAAIRGQPIPKKGLGLWNRLLYRLGTPRYSKAELLAVKKSEDKLEGKNE